MEMIYSAFARKKILWEKKNMLIISIFLFFRQYFLTSFSRHSINCLVKGILFIKRNLQDSCVYIDNQLVSLVSFNPYGTTCEIMDFYGQLRSRSDRT